ncbi:MAG: hypothetical protein K8I27_00475 [Planctomycetes bacterium]|nr:hypothetical protein [Planctomycetota bacterium]
MFTKRRNQQFAWLAILGIVGAVILIDLTVHHHAHFEGSEFTFDTLPEFYPMFGFLSAFFLILVAKTLAIALKRKDTFYADD